MNNEAILAFLTALDRETTIPISNLTYEERSTVLQKGLRALAAALQTTVNSKEN